MASRLVQDSLNRTSAQTTHTNENMAARKRRASSPQPTALWLGKDFPSWWQRLVKAEWRERGGRNNEDGGLGHNSRETVDVLWNHHIARDGFCHLVEREPKLKIKSSAKKMKVTTIVYKDNALRSIPLQGREDSWLRSTE